MTAPQAFDDDGDDEWDDWDDDVDGDQDAAEPELAYTSVDAWVTGHLAPLIRRRVNGSLLTWCPAWWKHPEAVSRLAALWRAWEHLRNDPGTGLSDWWVHHADPHLTALLDPDTGPFAVCHPVDGHTDRPLAPLNVLPSPPEMWLSPTLSDQDTPGEAPAPTAAFAAGTD